MNKLIVILLLLCGCASAQDNWQFDKVYPLPVTASRGWAVLIERGVWTCNTEKCKSIGFGLSSSKLDTLLLITNSTPADTFKLLIPSDWKITEETK